MKRTHQEIKEMLEKITPQPWNIIHQKFESPILKFDVLRKGPYTQEDVKNDLNIITAAPEIITQLLSECEVMREALEEIMKTGTGSQGNTSECMIAYEALEKVSK